MQADSNPLGQRSEYPAQVNAAILCPVERAAARGALGVAANALPFVGSDIWNAWELSWLDTRGQPCIAVAELRVPCTSPRLVESKSLKLYLNGYAM
ncbi:MAG: NADPH-dependent 7-cyano-7-deazaguanine reductase QueF, partial [Sinobacteraceae bacterium]|nr:NADPH-dependent 7-cyano-7-deazaguanine reductase QueF [Nevskiaceae bacterium]